MIIEKIPLPGMPEAAEVAALMDAHGIAFQKIARVNWPEDYPECPNVMFRIAHSDTMLLLNYVVSETHVRAVAEHDGGRVWEDSCCEFFVEPFGDGLYYNFECNCGEKLLLACGEGRENRRLAPPDTMSAVSRCTTFGNRLFANSCASDTWQLSMVIPVSAFFLHPGARRLPDTIRANFYKCGDLLPTPHYLSWAPIDAPRPDFHRPDSFVPLSLRR